MSFAFPDGRERRSEAAIGIVFYFDEDQAIAFFGYKVDLTLLGMVVFFDYPVTALLKVKLSDPFTLYPILITPHTHIKPISNLLTIENRGE